MGVTYNPNDDGTTHINVFSRGKTYLGRKLSNFERVFMEHPEYGPFASMEGFYYYISSGMQHDVLRQLYGAVAKKVGQGLSRVTINDFESILKSGLWAKYNYNVEMFDTLFLTSVTEEGDVLPLTHYYVFGSANEIVVPKGSAWLIEGWNEIRTHSLEKQDALY